MSRDDTEILERSAAFLQEYAIMIRGCACIGGHWSSTKERQRYVDVMMRVLQLRQLAEGNAPYHYTQPTYPRIEYKNVAPGRPRGDKEQR